MVVQRKRPITTAKKDEYSEADVPQGDEVEVVKETTVGEPTKKFAATTTGDTTEERLTDLGTRMAADPNDALPELVQQFASVQDEEERLNLLVMANSSGNEALAIRILTAAMAPKQPRAIRVQALEFWHARRPEMAQKYVNDPDPYVRFTAKTLLGLNPEPPDEAP